MRMLGSVCIVLAGCALAAGWLELGGGLGSDLKLTLIGTGFLISGSFLLGNAAVLAAHAPGREQAPPPPAETPAPLPDARSEAEPQTPAIRRPGFHRHAA